MIAPRTLVAAALGFGLAAAGCANPYCGASGEPCCGTECAPGLSCVLGTCTTGVVAACGAEGQSCCAGDLCGSGLSCYGGTCSPTRPRCDPFALGSCGAGMHCAWSGIDSPACWANGPSGPEGACTTPADCADGLGCDDSPTMAAPQCRVPCRVDGDCLGVSRLGMCLDYAYPSPAKYCW
ncbi:MAG: hypothetical protein U0234_17350 [Sandaracinus sp.]